MLSLSLIFVLHATFGSGIPPLSENVQIRLSTAVDGQDSRGESFAAILEHVSEWKSPIEAEFKEIPISALLAHPEQYRGVLVRFQGALEQTSPQTQPWEGVHEWFVRDQSGALLCIYVVGSNQISVGDSISGIARFYKTMSMEGRDSQIRMYPTFVTSPLAIDLLASSNAIPTPLLLLPVLLFASIIVFILARLGKRKRPIRHRVPIQTDDVVDAMINYASDLPDNASQALAKMFEQSEGDA
ncbi:MAG TPA: hypothetical protein EYN11_02600 [Phycisphaerales bacterium]|nr:hypothetical protein [Phycisphaerales bacterium]